MGIPGLWKEIFLVVTESILCTFGQLGDTTIAFDTYPLLWLFGFCYAAKDTMYDSMAHCIADMLTSFSIQILQWGIQPVFVFDGASLPLKRAAQERRREIRPAEENSNLLLTDKARTVIELTIGNTKQSAAIIRRIKRSLVNIDSKLRDDVIDRVSNKIEGFKTYCQIASFEADALLTKLAREKKNDGIVTIDSDLLLMAGQFVPIYRLPRSSNINAMNSNLQRFNITAWGERIYVQEVVKGKLQLNNLRIPQVIAVSCLVGCDYCLGGLPGFGFSKAINLVFHNMKVTEQSTDEENIAAFEQMLKLSVLNHIVEETKQALIQAFKEFLSPTTSCVHISPSSSEGECDNNFGEANIIAQTENVHNIEESATDVDPTLKFEDIMGAIFTNYSEESLMQTKKVPDLRHWLQCRNESATGKKLDLILRIMFIHHQEELGKRQGLRVVDPRNLRAQQEKIEQIQGCPSTKIDYQKFPWALPVPTFGNFKDISQFQQMKNFLQKVIHN